MGQIWDFLIVQPIAWLLRSFYSLTGNYGVAILMFAIAAKLILFFFSFKGKRGMLKQQRLQPKIEELQKKFGTDKQKLQQAQAKLYQDEGVSMFGGCLWMLIPFPLIIALYGAVRQPMQYIWQLTLGTAEAPGPIMKIADALMSLGKLPETFNLAGPYSQMEMARALDSNTIQAVQNALPDLQLSLSPINFNFLGIPLDAIPAMASISVLIPVISALTSFMSVWLTQKFSGRPAPKGAGNTMIMTYLLGPGISLWLGFTLPAALGVYWIAQNLLSIPQEYFLTKHFNKVLDAEDAYKAELEERRKAAEAAQKEEDRKRRAERIAAQNKKHKPKRYKLQNKPTPPGDEE